VVPGKTSQSYGIDDAIKLMRTLPLEENPDLVVRVLKTTLESLSVRVTDILADANVRQDALRGRISEFQGVIAQFEREIESRRREIQKLEEELAETTNVRDRLQLAEATASSPPKSKTPSVAPPKKPELLPGGARSGAPLPPFKPKFGTEPSKWAQKPSTTPNVPAVAPPPPGAVAAAGPADPSAASKSGEDDDDWPKRDSEDTIT
jgi:hypothetical protein